MNICVWMPDSLVEELKKKAFKEDRSVSYLVKKAVADSFE